MKGLLLFIISVLAACGINDPPESSFAKLKGPFLGQKPPGKKAELFAPGWLGAGGNESNITFSPDGRELCFSFSTGGWRNLAKPSGVFRRGFMMYSRIEKGCWTEPIEFSFSSTRQDHYPFFGSDGKKLFFNSNRKSVSPADKSHAGIWYIQRKDDGWSEPKEIKFGRNYRGGKGIYPTVAANGNLYFALWPTNENGYIFMSRYEEGKYLSPVKLSNAINDLGGNHPYIAPDESYLIFDDDRMEDNYGELDLFISFRDKKGKWMKAQNLGERINTVYGERRPFVTFDGKYLFFSSDRVNPQLPDAPLTLKELRNLTNVNANGFQRIYWIDAKVIDESKPEELKTET